MGLLKDAYKKYTTPEQIAKLKSDSAESVMKGIAMIPGEFLRVKAIRYMEEWRKRKGM